MAFRAFSRRALMTLVYSPPCHPVIAAVTLDAVCGETRSASSQTLRIQKPPCPCAIAWLRLVYEMAKAPLHLAELGLLCARIRIEDQG